MEKYCKGDHCFSLVNGIQRLGTLELELSKLLNDKEKIKNGSHKQGHKLDRIRVKTQNVSISSNSIYNAIRSSVNQIVCRVGSRTRKTNQSQGSKSSKCFDGLFFCLCFQLQQHSFHYIIRDRIISRNGILLPTDYTTVVSIDFHQIVSVCAAPLITTLTIRVNQSLIPTRGRVEELNCHFCSIHLLVSPSQSRPGSSGTPLNTAAKQYYCVLLLTHMYSSLYY